MKTQDETLQIKRQYRVLGLFQMSKWENNKSEVKQNSSKFSILLGWLTYISHSQIRTERYIFEWLICTILKKFTAKLLLIKQGSKMQRSLSNSWEKSFSNTNNLIHSVRQIILRILLEKAVCITKADLVSSFCQSILYSYVFSDSFFSLSSFSVPPTMEKLKARTIFFGLW